MNIYNQLVKQEGNEEYYRKVFKDITEVKKEYPFMKILFVPTNRPTLLGLEVIAVNRNIISKTFSKSEDFLSEFSKKVYLVIPLNYTKKGCTVYGGGWINSKLVSNKSRHFYDRTSFNEYELCVGVPNEFLNNKNVILENIKTTENMLVEYEKIMKGDATEFEGLAYSHGEEGINEFRRKKHGCYGIGYK